MATWKKTRQEFLAFPKTTGAEMKIVLAMLYGVKA